MWYIIGELVDSSSGSHLGSIGYIFVRGLSTVVSPAGCRNGQLVRLQVQESPMKTPSSPKFADLLIDYSTSSTGRYHISTSPPSILRVGTSMSKYSF